MFRNFEYLGSPIKLKITENSKYKLITHIMNNAVNNNAIRIVPECIVE